jgi:hypothetical protein
VLGAPTNADRRFACGAQNVCSGNNDEGSYEYDTDSEEPLPAAASAVVSAAPTNAQQTNQPTLAPLPAVTVATPVPIATAGLGPSSSGTNTGGGSSGSNAGGRGGVAKRSADPSDERSSAPANFGGGGDKNGGDNNNNNNSSSSSNRKKKSKKPNEVDDNDDDDKSNSDDNDDDNDDDDTGDDKGEGEFLVEEIVGEKNGFYEVKWAGFAATTFEPLKNVKGTEALKNFVSAGCVCMRAVPACA